MKFTLKSLSLFLFLSFQVNALSSVSMTCAIVSGITVYHYKWAVNRMLLVNLLVTNYNRDSIVFASKDETLKLTDQENTAVAITSLIVIFSIIEIALAVGGTWSSDSPYQSPQENQVSHVCKVISLVEA